jgi:hypothetical protein
MIEKLNHYKMQATLPPHLQKHIDRLEKKNFKVTDVTPEGFAPTQSLVEKEVIERIGDETLDEAIARKVQYQIDNGKVTITEDQFGWGALVKTSTGPRVFAAYKRQDLMNQVFQFLYPQFA